MKFLHAADIHLDSPLRGLERYDGAPVDAIRGATRAAFDNLIALAIETPVDFVVIAGDVYDGQWPDFGTGLYFARAMAKLNAAGIPAFVLHGNHDAESKITRALTLPANVRVFDHAAPSTFRLEHLGVVLHGQSFATPDVRTNLAAGYPDAEPGAIHIGVLHTAASGAPGHDPYAPCTVDELRAKGYAYWALGHVHARGVLSTSPPIVYPGNLQGRHIRETGPKGATIVTISDRGEITHEHRDLDVLRWCEVLVDATPLSTSGDVVAAVRELVAREVALAQPRPVALRIRVTGRSAAHADLWRDAERTVNDLRATATDAGLAGGGAWVEKVKIETQPAFDRARLSEGDDPMAQVLRTIDRVRADPRVDEALVAPLRELFLARLPSDARRTDDAPDPANPAQFARLLDDAEALILARYAPERDA